MTEPKACTVDGCERSKRSSGAKYCEMHYYRVRRTGEVGPAAKKYPDQVGICEVPGCGKAKCSSGVKYCSLHYHRMRRTGTVEDPAPSVPVPCPVEGCDRTVQEGGMCKLHATRFRRHGDSRVVIAQADRDLARGERNTNWTGDQATYWAVHQRLKYRRGSAKKYQCVDCQERARQWSYDHADPNGRVGEDGLPYSTSLDHYQPRCVPCHKAFDLARIAALRASALAAGEAPGPTDSPLLPACLQPKGDGGRCGICRVDLALQAADPRYGSPSDLDHP